MKKTVFMTPLVAALFLVGANLSAEAASYSLTATFDSLASGVGATGGVGPTGSIQNYLQSLLSGGATVSVTAGAVVTDQAYNGDGHVVGPAGSPTVSTTLGPDTFVKNTAGIAGWSFNFTGLTITAVSFDYEIFPNGNCTSLTTNNCGTAANGSGIWPNQPDLTFSTNLGTIFHYYGLKPGSGASGPPLNPLAPSATSSPCTTGGVGSSCTGAPELTPQLIGTTALLNGLNITGATSLTWMDWPATIAIDSLRVDYNTPGPVPEPASMLLVGSGFAALYARRKKRLAA